MNRTLALLLALALPAAAQEAPSVSVAIDPRGPVTVGAPVRVALTVLVPSYMPEPPVWPDLQIADAITRLPERATTPVTRRIGGVSWSGLTRSYEITPQRAADYDLADAAVTLTWAGDAAPQTATLPVPDIAFSATVPPGAEGLDPFLAADSLAVAATAAGLPDAPKPGDAVTLTLTTTASGPPAMLLPSLADRIPTPAGLRAYPKEPTLTDTPGARGGPSTAERVESITYVIEAPGSYALPPVSLSWWNTGTGAVAASATEPIAFDVPAPPGWNASGEMGARGLRPALLLAGAAAVALLVAAIAAIARRRVEGREAKPTERRAYRDLRRSVRAGPAGELRRRVLGWTECIAPHPPSLTPDIEKALVEVERSAYGDTPAAPDARRVLLAALADRRTALLHNPHRRAGHLPPLNPEPRSS